jgi:hypothetical protein
MNDPETLRAAEEKMNHALFAYSHAKWIDAELHKRLLDDLKQATNEFLSLREEQFRGQREYENLGRVAEGDPQRVSRV